MSWAEDCDGAGHGTRLEALGTYVNFERVYYFIKFIDYKAIIEWSVDMNNYLCWF